MANDLTGLNRLIMPLDFPSRLPAFLGALRRGGNVVWTADANYSPQEDPVTSILIDARRSQGVRTGVGHYTKSIISNWPPAASPELLFRADLPVEQLPSSRNHVLPSGPLWHWRAAQLARKAGALYFSPESLLAPLLVGKRALITVHDLTPLLNPSVHTRWNVLVHRLFMRLALRRVGAIVVPTETVKRDLARFFPWAESKTQVVAEGVRDLTVDPERGTDAPQFDGPYALYVGTIEPRKNVVPLIEAFLEVAPAEWRLILVGKIGWLDAEGRNRFLTLTEHKQIEHLGFVPDEWLPSLFSGADAFCYVSDAEGFGLPVAEAMAAGLVVVHSDDPALMEVGQGVGVVVRRERLAADLRAALRRVTRLTTDERSEVAQRGRTVSAKFDWALASERTNAILSGLRS